MLNINWNDLITLELKNKNVLIRPVDIDDFQPFSEIAYDENIWSYFTSSISCEDHLKDFIKDAVVGFRTRSKATFCIIDRSNNRIAGSMSYANIVSVNSCLEIGWSWLGTEFHGCGINKNAKYLLMQYAFESLNAKRVEFKTDVLNVRARHGLRSIGATEEGTLRSHTLMPGGRRRDTIYYSVLEHEWPGVKQMLADKMNA